MTKDEMRQMLATLVPAAIADGRAYVVRHAAGKKVRDLPTPQVQTKPMRPMRYLHRHGVNGAGFKVQTFKPRQGVDCTQTPFANNIPQTHPTYFCHICDNHGADCVC